MAGIGVFRYPLGQILPCPRPFWGKTILGVSPAGAPSVTQKRTAIVCVPSRTRTGVRMRTAEAAFSSKEANIVETEHSAKIATPNKNLSSMHQDAGKRHQILIAPAARLLSSQTLIPS